MRRIRSLVSLVTLVPASAVGMAVGGVASTSCGGITESREVDDGWDASPGDDAADDVDSGLPDVTVCEPMAWYGPPPCQTDLDCEQQNGTGWYCNTANTMDDGCSSVPYPVCEPLPSIDAGTVDSGILDLDSGPWVAWYGCPTPGEPCVPTIVCGDGIVDENEACDDGNTSSGDGCSSTCLLEISGAGGAGGEDGAVAGAAGSGGAAGDLAACAQACQDELCHCLAAVPDGGTTDPCSDALTVCVADCRLPQPQSHHVATSEAAERVRVVAVDGRVVRSGQDLPDGRRRSSGPRSGAGRCLSE
jgi:cysteine-rich repeat protein